MSGLYPSPPGPLSPKETADLIRIDPNPTRERGMVCPSLTLRVVIEPLTAANPLNQQSPKRGEGEKTRFDQRSRHPSYCQNARLDQAKANVEGASSKYFWLAEKNELFVVFGNSCQSIVCSGAGK
jgi:hypothetical protein